MRLSIALILAAVVLGGCASGEMAVPGGNFRVAMDGKGAFEARDSKDFLAKGVVIDPTAKTFKADFIISLGSPGFAAQERYGEAGINALGQFGAAVVNKVPIIGGGGEVIGYQALGGTASSGLNFGDLLALMNGAGVGIPPEVLAAAKAKVIACPFMGDAQKAALLDLIAKATTIAEVNAVAAQVPTAAPTTQPTN